MPDADADAVDHVGRTGTDHGVLDRFRLDGRVAIVTGGSRGIGQAIAEAYSAAGAAVVIASRKPEPCEAVAAVIRARGGRALAVAAHLGDLDSVRSLVDRTVEEFGGVDIVVNNAANELALPVGGITSEAFDKSFSVNVRGPLFLVQYALPHLIKSGHGAVVNVISVAVYMRAEGLGLYAAGKSALASFTKTMAGELAVHGVRVNALAPGTVDTAMVRKLPQEAQDSLAVASPLGRMAAADEMAGPALLLASDAGSYMTGQVLVVDGGLTVR
jgi:NAD(P)-dependent dehydrogenase (short-subunit alcohol dehydrogenase family)